MRRPFGSRNSRFRANRRQKFPIARIRRTKWERPEIFRCHVAWKISVLLLLLVAAVLAFRKLHSRSGPSPAIHSLAVLPFESLSNDASQDYFADGMTDELISDLGQISALRVISRTSVMSYKRARKPLPQIARELNVDAVVEGTVLRSGNEVRITAQLIEASADKHLWSQSYEGELRDTLALQNDVARAIADQIRINLNPQEQAALKKVRVVDPESVRILSQRALLLEQANSGGFECCPGILQSGNRRRSHVCPSLFWFSRHIFFVGRLAVCGDDAEGGTPESESVRRSKHWNLITLSARLTTRWHSAWMASNGILKLPEKNFGEQLS